MPTTLIASNPSFQKEKINGDHLMVSELFANTIQGENFYYPSTFLRLMGCTLDCVWCDTTSVWKYGNPYSFEEIFILMEQHDLIEAYRKGQRWIYTGGSPLKQQRQLVNFTQSFIHRYAFKPYIEVENEVVLKPIDNLIQYVDQWNNSPKLENSLMKKRARYKPDVIEFTAKLNNSWFKFVVGSEEDWNEIQSDYLDTKLITRDQIVLMPLGETREELQKSYEHVVNVCVRENLRMSDRLHVTIWNKKTGV